MHKFTMLRRTLVTLHRWKLCSDGDSMPGEIQGRAMLRGDPGGADGA